MNYQSHFKILILSILVLILSSCSSGRNPVSPGSGLEEKNNSNNVSGMNSDDFSTPGLLGAYELNINADMMSAELTPKRISAIGEDYIVSGIGFFTAVPCPDCFKLNSLSFSGGNLVLNFYIEHPFAPGNPGDPPSGKNRLDLNIFDLAMVIVPSDAAPESFPLTGASAYMGILANADGYTTELADVTGDDAASPYVLVIDQSDTASHTWNVFPMGGNAYFDAVFSLAPGSGLRFDTYLTMGYGASAKKPTRLTPKYYNPEFNRKAAWKVVTASEYSWQDNDSTTPTTVAVAVYDWQTNAVVSTDPNFADSDPTKVFAASEIEMVSVEVPGMNSSLQSVTAPAGGSGMPTDPLIFVVPVANSNLLSTGTYPGLVKVTDSRETLDPATNPRDFLIDTPDGIALNNHIMPEYAAYQTFTARVLGGSGWARSWGDPINCQGWGTDVNSAGNIYVTGNFDGTADFDPGPGIENHTSNGGVDIFLSKFDGDGNLVWTRTWGGTGALELDLGKSVASDVFGNVYVGGTFNGTVDFDPGIGVDSKSTVGTDDCFVSCFDSDGNYKWARTWGGTDIDQTLALDVDEFGNCYVTGRFRLAVDFGDGNPITSSGFCDVFISRFDPDGNLTWVVTWGGTGSDRGYGIELDNSGNIFVCGYFTAAVDFDPSSGTHNHTAVGARDIFLSCFDTSSGFQWAETWGGIDIDTGYGVSADSSGNVYVTGSYIGTVDFDPTGVTENKTAVGGSDVFLSCFNSSGIYLWAKSWGGIANDQGNGIATYDPGNIYVTGYYQQMVDFDPGGSSYNLTSLGVMDIFLSKFDSSGNFTWAQSFGGVSTDEGIGVATDNWGNVFCSGYFQGSVDFNPGIGSDIHTSSYLSDAYLMKLLPSGFWN